MIKKMLAVFTAVIMLAVFIRPEIYGDHTQAYVSVYINGEKLSGDAEPMLINDRTYVPFRAFCDMMGADCISWNDSTRTASAKCRGITVDAGIGDIYIVANGRYPACDKTLLIGGRTYVPIRELAAAFRCGIEWNEDEFAVYVNDTYLTIEPAEDYYDGGDVYWLSRIISAEAQGEPLNGKIAVGNVILNRVSDASYPDTLYGVIFDRKYGTQFTPVASGKIYNTPTAESIIAAKICLDGYSISDKILFFMNPEIAVSTWIANNRKYAFTIENHAFYY